MHTRICSCIWKHSRMINKKRGVKMSKLIYWIRMRFNRNMQCGSFCPTCEYYERCKYDR